ncbi:FKBP-type peptidyl-prolyl cis-trans isomerase [Flammeovirga aprica]|uniref:Peptidyl-prolyl cis-trans isomerase n=1 Tax=Flammeovirga aprica JL-4 TaxID=694437 RepID=A0A7X9P2U0_9BACT|nr:FKBP-type peptidyl-prolyl cis-trans isomerase [Flammeovirga aprica]NME67377.1 peptidylprolyl isomerase [Flammeovirga aprica JL-4]
MKATKDKVVTLVYSLSEETAEGTLLQKVEKDDPFEFLFGHMDVLPEFETELEGKEAGYTFSFSISKENAYGERQDAAVVKVPKEVFNIEDEIDQNEILKVGNVLPMVGPDEMPMEGEVTEVHDDHVVMDFNHPLAGTNLYFTGEIIDVRDATKEELEEAVQVDNMEGLEGLEGLQ